MLAVVVPTCRPESMEIFLPAWTPLFEKHDVELILVEDKQSTWDVMPDFVPRRSGSIRSWGFLQAWQRGFDVLTLDDDCLPVEGTDPIKAHLDAFMQSWGMSDYFDIGHTFGLGEFMRGYPFHQRDGAGAILQYGGWDNVPDLDAVTQRQHELLGPVHGFEFDRKTVAIPKGVAFTGCIMNVAIKHEAIPLLYQLVMGDKVGYDRWDDIWSGLFAKKICDHLSLPILVNGKASVVHTRASNTESNYAKEKNGYSLNDAMWRNLDAVILNATSVIGCYFELINQLHPDWFGPNGQVIIDGMREWVHAIVS